MSSAFLNRTSQAAKRVRYLGLVGVVVVTSLLGTAALFIGKAKVSPQAIASSVTRTPELLERAWHLPVAATFNRQLISQSNISRCGPASVANAYLSLCGIRQTQRTGCLLARGGAGQVSVFLASPWTSWPMLHEPMRDTKSPSYAISAKKNFASICVTRMIPDAATS